MSYILTCESTADLTAEQFESRNIKVVCFHFALDGKEYMDDLGVSVPFPEFYEKVSAGCDTRTSQVNISEYEEFWTPYLEAGENIVHISLSSGLSGTVNSARNAARLLKEKFPEREISVVDSLGASSGYGMLVLCAADLRDQGKTEEEVVAWLEKEKRNLNHWFFSTDLSSYVRGGRISKAAAVFGGILEICPLLNMDGLGRLVPRMKVRKKSAVISEIVKQMEKNAAGGPDYAGKCRISHSNCYEDARAVADLVEKRFPKLDGKVEINWVGTTIGAHTGPGTVALYFFGEERV